MKRFFDVSDSFYFEYFKEKVLLLPEVEDIFMEAEKQIGTSISDEIKNKYKKWYNGNKENILNFINEKDLRKR